ncbi:MAG: hypothetical protein CM15mP120_16220 [Pseudomonadota bacterium]|nr:MAG: hypothetical protein CM15mP120_16220 [Pseudomonadota bacterium]
MGQPLHPALCLKRLEGERVIQRVTVMGDQVEAAAQPVAQPWVREGRKSATSRYDRQMRQYFRSRDQKRSTVDSSPLSLCHKAAE